MKVLRKHSHVLVNFNSFPKQIRKNILQNPTPGLVKCITEICVNIIFRTIRLTHDQIEYLVEKTDLIHKLGSKKASFAVKKKLFKKLTVIKLIEDLIRFSLPTLKERGIIDNV